MESSPARALAHPPSTPSVAVRRLPLTFTGGAGEYFRIWIVNVLLSVVTLSTHPAVQKRVALLREMAGRVP